MSLRTGGPDAAVGVAEQDRPLAGSAGLSPRAADPPHAPASEQHPAYRPDIDGLRAVAVLSVVLFHAFPGLLPGGFVGVDVFFVISGFLISTIILRGLSSGRFSFATFYARRVRRIFPALLVMLSATLAAGWWLLFADEYSQLGKHVFGGAAFVSNLLLRRESGYFDVEAASKPLLHLWSLGIEEQFYIAWPLMLWAAHRRRVRALPFILAVLAVSFTFSFWLLHRDPAGAFYSPLSRAWELLTGAVLACATLHHAARVHLPNPRAADALSLLGAACLAAGLVLIDEQRAFPGLWALLPTMGSVALIAAGPTAWVNRTVLARRWMVGVGLVSYPLYLWHWPLLSGARIVESGGVVDPVVRVGLVVAAFVLAWCTYRLVESPLRFSGWRAVTPALAGGMTVVAGAGFLVHARGGFEGHGFRAGEEQAFVQYFENSAPEWRYFTRIDLPGAYWYACDFYDQASYRAGHATNIPVDSISAACYTRDRAMPHAVLVWGDSHAQQFHPGLKAALPADWQLMQIASSGCDPSPRVRADSRTDYCARSNFRAVQAIARARPDVVLVAQNTGHSIAEMSEIARTLHGLGVGRVIFAGPTPHWGSPLPKLLSRMLRPEAPRYMSAGLDQDVLDANRALERAFPRAEGQSYANVIGALCTADGCLTHVGEDPQAGITSFDYGHLTPPASELVARTLLVPAIVAGARPPGAADRRPGATSAPRTISQEAR